jgi:DNA-binding response OmpR family regulator
MADILIIDDEFYVRKLYTEFLSREGYNVSSVTNCHDALEAVKKEKFDLVILDIELQDSNGLEILRQLKNENPGLLVILNTAFSIYKSDFSTWIADAYIMKSSDLNPLNDKINELLGVKNQVKK